MTGGQYDGLPITEAQFQAWYAGTRRRRGLPLTIEDPALLDRLVTLAFAGERGGGADPDVGRRRRMNRKPRRRGQTAEGA
jgi:hypothetical protein